MMPRFRRYRVFLIFAAVITFLLIRLTHRNDWPQYSQTAGLEFAAPKGKEEEAYVAAKPASRKPQWTPKPQVGEGLVEPEKPARQQTTAVTVPKTTSSPAPNTAKASTQSAQIATPTIPEVVLPERKKPPPQADSYAGETYDTDVDDIHPIAPPGRQELIDIPAASSTIHWQKQVEHFPVPTGEIIKLPTGKPVAIPKIQYAFEDETSDAKRTREKRQTRVKEEFKKSWEGYKKYAWLHDELSPVSGKFRDPFCGWAATLVDTLDTLWIMGLEDEFEEAITAVESIDFTTSPRNDIPMFETTIRYLGGLLAAYDVSGGKYASLLNKAAELAEILIGAFDTPNRMPVLYYRWKPAFASQPHRASQRSNLAELGSLSLEFTRLAQLTHDQKYYDAIARVTNALEEWQNRGTRLGSVFPENVDASGCNRTVELTSQQPLSATTLIPSKEEEQVLGYQPNSPDTVPEPRKKGVKESPSGPDSLQVQFTPGEPGKAHIKDWDSTHGNDEKKEKKKTSKRTPPPPPDSPISPVSGLPMTAVELESKELQLTPENWDCKPQGLEPANEQAYVSAKFGMGGGQDSTYEYYPKQFLLLGGLEAQYRKMYLKTVDDIKKWMLYRPMIPDNRDILFSGSVMTKGDPHNDLDLMPEVEHLTCFIGGMIGMAAKIFDLEEDLEIAKKLTDGCVWAYESTPHGIMPESAIVVPCKSSEHCTWNETKYYHELDPNWDTRDQDIADYTRRKKEVDTQLEANAKAAATKKEAERINAINREVDEDREDVSPQGNGTAALERDEPVSLQKRQIESSPKLEIPKPITHNFKDGSTNGKKPSENSKTTKIAPKPGSSTKIPSPADKFYEQKAELTEADLRNIATGGRLDEFPPDEIIPPVVRDPSMPFTHKEYVETRLRQETLPLGFTLVKSRKYILRPEAIESVWYMHRITGDSTWADKGWNMFENIINSTSTTYGHSAIFDVTAQRNETNHMDEMESFWLAETLKYFYLLYSTPDVISLDEWVLNTEAHPFKRPA